MAPKGKSEPKGGDAPASGSRKKSESGGSGFLTGAFVGIVVGAVLVVAALKFELVPIADILGVSPGEGSCPACPAVKDDGCKKELGQVKGQLQTHQAAQQKAEAAQSKEQKVAAECKGQLQECQAKAKASSKAEDASAAAAKATPKWSRGPWPQCSQKDMALRGKADEVSLQDLSALLGSAAAGCRMGDCAATDKFDTPRPEDCARACAALEKCSFWSHGGNQCFLRASAAGHEAASGFVSAPKDCVPPPTKISARQAVLAVLDSDSLRSCDGGKNAACPDLHDAMRTWEYAIESLESVLKGKEHNFANFVEQISNDAGYFLNMGDEPPAGVNLGEMYGVAAANNRQVLDAIRSWLQTNDVGKDDNEAQISKLDISVPRPARGLLCQGSCTVV